MGLNRFNIALLPTDQNLQALFQRISQSYFGAHHEDYLLGNGALAHVTLCQFRALGPPEALNVFCSFADRKKNNLRLGNARYRRGDSKHKGFLWAEYLVETMPPLLDMQRRCFDHLIANGYEVLTAWENYSPHITLARVGQSKEAWLQQQIRAVCSDEPVPYNDPIEFTPIIGPSTENGVLLGSYEIR